MHRAADIEARCPRGSKVWLRAIGSGPQGELMNETRAVTRGQHGRRREQGHSMTVPVGLPAPKPVERDLDEPKPGPRLPGPRQDR